MNTLFQIDEFGKKEPQISCPHCATSLICRHGTYQRAHPKKPVLIKVQRFLCKKKLCPRVTFSVLPYPFLPVVRHFFWTIQYCHVLCNLNKTSQAKAARRMAMSRGVIKRLSAFAEKFMSWFDHEKHIGEWGPSPDLKPSRFWSDFTRDISRSLYPKRWPIYPPTQ